MRFASLLLITLSLSCLSLSSYSKSNELDVVFIVPNKPGQMFWDLTVNVARAVAIDLRIHFDVVYANSDRFAVMAAVEDLVKRDDKPDYVIMRPFWGIEESIFRKLRLANIPFVTIESSFDSNKINADLHKNWISKVEYDNYQGGKLLAETLIQVASLRYSHRPIEILGIGGDFDLVSINRQKYLAELHKDTTQQNIVHQVIPFYWNVHDVKLKLPILLKRYPQTKVLWVAGDEMALAAIASHRNSAKGRVIGGFDWVVPALVKIKNGEMHASVGGHFLMASHALIDIYKHHYNLVDNHEPREKLNYELIDEQNIEQYLPFFKNELWKTVSYKPFVDENENKRIPLTVDNLMKLVK